jgi:hypothetical protein
MNASPSTPRQTATTSTEQGASKQQIAAHEDAGHGVEPSVEDRSGEGERDDERRTHRTEGV